MHRFEKLKVWKKAFDMSITFHELALNFPREEKYGLTSQAKRAVVSISSNIAEGAGRNNKKEFLYFLNVASGSACEFESQIMMAWKMNWMNENEFNRLKSEIQEIRNMLFSLQKAVNKASSSHLQEEPEPYFLLDT